MICPRCRQALRSQVRVGVVVDSCDHCGGMWLDAGELEALTAHTIARTRYLADLADDGDHDLLAAAADRLSGPEGLAKGWPR